MKLKRNDIYLCILIGILIVLSFFAYRFLHHKNGDLVQVTIDSKVVKTLPLDKDTTYKIQTKKEGYNLLQIKNGSVCILEADCPDKLCVHQKKITKQGESLICLPHKTVVSIVSSDKTKLDGIAQ